MMITSLDPLLVHDSTPALSAPDGLPRIDLIRRSAVGTRIFNPLRGFNVDGLHST